MLLITNNHWINQCTQKLSLSFLVTTVWTLWTSTCTPPFIFLPKKSTFFAEKSTFLPKKKSFSSCDGRHEQFSCFPIYFQFLLSSRHCCVPKLRVCHHQHLGDERALGGSWAFLQASIRQICPPSSPSDSLSPSVPSSPQSPNTLRISWTYIEDILGVY